MATKSRSKHQKDLYGSYKSANRQASNRKRKLERALKRNPENLEIVAALKNISYRRKTPGTPQWSHQQIATAMLFKSFKRGTSKVVTPCTEKQMFALKTRAHMQGVGIWSS